MVTAMTMVWCWWCRETFDTSNEHHCAFSDTAAAKNAGLQIEFLRWP